MVIIMLYFSLFLFINVCLISFIFLNKIMIKTSTMAAIMALGILIEGVISNFFGHSVFYGVYGKILSIIIIALWISFLFSLCLSFVNKKFKDMHINNPINRFGMGTWVAGTSICGMIIFQQFSGWIFFTKILSYLNVGVWLLYIGMCIRGYYELYKNQQSKNVHGILLLTAVSTQSLVLLLNTVYDGIPFVSSLFLLAIGVCFYVISCFFIIKRYSSRTVSWSIVKDWNNTNCILHGALSITGLASITSHAVNNQSIIGIWILVAVIFLIVESFEVHRLIKRMKDLGIQKGILIYDVSQWSRIFTFGMFYTFTSLIEPRSLFILFVQKMISTIGVWIIFALVIIEILLCFHFLLLPNLKRLMLKKHIYEKRES